MADLKPGLYRLTKSLANPYGDMVKQRDLMADLRALPEGWDWLVYHDPNPHDPNPPLMVIAACGGWCESLYVHEAEYKVAMEDWNNEGTPPLLASPEFLAALEPREPDTYTRVRQCHKFALPDRDGYKFDRVMECLIETGKLKAQDLLEAMTYVVEHEDELRNKPSAGDLNDQLYSDAVNEVFNETGEHWID